MPRFPLSILILLLLAFPAHAKRRAAGAPGGDAWTAPLREIAGNASIVALGDATHGTHEFYAIKIPLLETLVRDLGYDVLSIEAPFPIMERVNAYAQGGPGDPRALLAEMSTRLHYFFWNVEEFLAVIEWVRTYNAHRGDRPPVVLAGADIYDEDGAVAGVLDYLRATDPAYARVAEEELACVVAGDRTSGCEAAAKRVREALLARDASADALHHSDITLQFFHLPIFEPREVSMAANLLWIREHRGSGKVVHWGHQEHVGKLPSTFTRGRTMGTILGEQLGSDYVAIGTLAGSGTFLQWEQSGTLWRESLQTLPEPPPDSYEAAFRALGRSPVLIPLRGRSGTASLRTGGTTSGWKTLTQSLPRKLDAVVFVNVSTPTASLSAAPHRR